MVSTILLCLLLLGIAMQSAAASMPVCVYNSLSSFESRDTASQQNCYRVIIRDKNLEWRGVLDLSDFPVADVYGYNLTIVGDDHVVSNNTLLRGISFIGSGMRPILNGKQHQRVGLRECDFSWDYNSRF
jgi:hypothetical protein